MAKHFITKENAKAIGSLGGRPVGSKDEKWKSIQAMWDLFMADFDLLTPAQRAHYSFEMVRLHFERAIAQLPKNQSDSLTNANKLMEDLKALEQSFVNGRRDTTDSKASLADRPTAL